MGVQNTPETCASVWKDGEIPVSEAMIQAGVAAAAALGLGWTMADAGDVRIIFKAMERARRLEAPSAGEVERLQHVIDRDRYVVAACLTAIKQAIHGRTWLLHGRGPYEWDDDRYREEFADALKGIEEAAAPLAIVAWDKSDCTRIEERVNAAKLAAREMLAKPPAPRAMIMADIFGDPRDAEIERLRVALSPARNEQEGWPAGLTAPLRHILGTMCFQIGNYAHAYRAAGEFVDAAGEQLKSRAEDEQAFILHRWLGYWREHGDDWEAAAVADINRVAKIYNEHKAAKKLKLRPAPPTDGVDRGA